MVSIPAPPRAVKSDGRNTPRAVRRDAMENRERILRTAAELMARRGHTVEHSHIDVSRSYREDGLRVREHR